MFILHILSPGTYPVSIIQQPSKRIDHKFLLYFDRPIRLSHLVVISPVMLVVYEFLYARIPLSWNMTPSTDVAKGDTVFIFKGLKFRVETL